jgi:hypothetical protein
MRALAVRVHNIHPTSLEGHLGRMQGEDVIRVNQKHEMYLVQCPHWGVEDDDKHQCDGCVYRVATDRNKRLMARIRAIVTIPRTAEELRAQFGPGIDTDDLIEAVQQLMARGKLVTNGERQFSWASSRRRAVRQPPEPPRSRFDIIDS